TPGRDQLAGRVVLANPVVICVRDVDVELSVDRDVDGVRELGRRSNDADEGSGRAEFLDSAVARVGDGDVSTRVDGDAVGLNELAGSGPRASAELADERVGRLGCGRNAERDEKQSQADPQTDVPLRGDSHWRRSSQVAGRLPS